jgi:hypothetical protein
MHPIYPDIVSRFLCRSGGCNQIHKDYVLQTAIDWRCRGFSAHLQSIVGQPVLKENRDHPTHASRDKQRYKSWVLKPFCEGAFLLAFNL